MKCLGLDIGSTRIKGGVLDLETHTVGSIATRPFPEAVSGLTAGWFEVSPRDVERAVEQVLRELISQAPDAAALYCTGQMAGVILVDDSGEPVTNYISWRDQRSLNLCASGMSYLDMIRRKWQGDFMVSLGNDLQSGSTATLLFWLARNDRLPWGVTPATVADFVLGRLCGVPPRMHVTQAGCLLNLQDSSWHHHALETLELGDGLRLPELADALAPVGQFRINGQSIRAYGSFGDLQCALRGACLEENQLSINASTGSQVSRRVRCFQPGNYQTRRYFDGDYLNTVTHLPAGRSLNVLVDLLTEVARAEGIPLRNAWETIVRLADTADDTDLQVDLTFFSGPMGSMGAIRQITTENFTVGNLFQAAYRNMADHYARAAEWIDAERTCQSLVFTGGLVQSIPQLQQAIQRRCPLPARESVGDDTMLGLLELARDSVPSP